MYATLRHVTIAACLAMFAFSVAVGSGSWVDWRSCAAFVILSIICEILPVRLSIINAVSCDSTFSFVIIWAAAILWGPIAAMLVAVVSVTFASFLGWVSCEAYFTLCAKLNSREQDPSTTEVHIIDALHTLAHTWLERRDYPASWVFQLTVFNACLEGLMSCLACVAYLAAGGILLGFSMERIGMQSFVLPVTIGVIVYVMGSITVFAMVGAIWEPDTSYRKTLRDFLIRWKILLRQHMMMHYANYLVLSPFAIILAYLQNQVGYASLAVVVLPLYAMRYAFALTIVQVTMYRDTITTLGTYMQHYHPYTRGHLKRVAEMSERLARELKLPTGSIMLMQDAGMLHDIGKVAVPEKILDKIGRLTDDEWNTIKEHPVKGAEIISHLEFLDRIVGWVKYHHKWHNGSGYPDDGTKEVPVEAAIIAVADAFDAMTDDRELSLEWTCDTCGYKPEDGSRPTVCPKCDAEKSRRYRQPMSRDQALNELRRGAGTQFHPEVVRAFLKIQLDNQIERERLALEQAA